MKHCNKLFKKGGAMNGFFMKTAILGVVLACLMLFAACSGNSAEDIFETAQFEELQNNREHAEQLYNDIIRKYPDSEYAAKSRERLSALKK